MLKEFKPELMFSDVCMLARGFEFLDWFREQAGTSCTRHPDTRFLKRGQTAQHDDCADGYIRSRTNRSA